MIAEPAGTSSRTDFVAKQIRRSILLGEAKPGERLVGAVWSERLGVSHTPIREAFQRLTAEGFLVYDPHRGARVASVSLREIREIYDLRINLEPKAVADSVSHGDRLWLAELQRSFKRLDALMTREYDFTDHLDLHSAFHKVLRARCTSSWLLRFTDILAAQSVRFATIPVGMSGGRESARTEHRELYEAARSGDAQRTAALLAHHLQVTLNAASAAASS